MLRSGLLRRSLSPADVRVSAGQDREQSPPRLRQLPAVLGSLALVENCGRVLPLLLAERTVSPCSVPKGSIQWKRQSAAAIPVQLFPRALACAKGGLRHLPSSRLLQLALRLASAPALLALALS
jgi:hypothetical protein